MDEEFYSVNALLLPLLGLPSRERPPDEPLPDLSDRCWVCGSLAIPETLDSGDPTCEAHEGYPGPPVKVSGIPVFERHRNTPDLDPETLEEIGFDLLALGDRADYSAFRVLGAAEYARGARVGWVESNYGVYDVDKLHARIQEVGLAALAELW